MSAINWMKAEKPYPKRTQTVASLMNFNNEKVKVSKNSLFSNMPTKKASSPKLRSFNDEDSDESDTNSEDENKETGKISFKDLCDEDKLKIANLVKELAKMSEEKSKIEKSLEEERRLKDTEIKEILKQQENLLNDKETLLNKFSRVQQKLDELKRQAKKNKTQRSQILNGDGDVLPPRPDSLQKKDQTVKSKKSNDQKSRAIDVSFNPYIQSSTPKNMSPRSLSPINHETKAVNAEQQKSLVLGDQHSEDLKRIELIKQRMELIEEQKRLAELLDQQELMLREKQSQIMLQQKIHRERLEEISRQKEDEKQTRSVVYYENTPLCQNNLDLLIQNQQNELNKLIYLNMNPVILSPNSSAANSNIQNLIPSKQDAKKSERIPNQVEENEVNLENLASLVYEKLIIKKNEEKKLKSFNSNDISNASVTSVKQENEKCLEDLICDEKIHLVKKQMKNKNTKTPIRTCTSTTNLDPKYFMNTNDPQEMEESKLIEELFFI